LDYKLVLSFVEAYCEKVKEIKEQIEKSEYIYPVMTQALAAINQNTTDKSTIEEAGLALKA
jgi:hypothetical protein